MMMMKSSPPKSVYCLGRERRAFFDLLWTMGQEGMWFDNSTSHLEEPTIVKERSAVKV